MYLPSTYGKGKGERKGVSPWKVSWHSRQGTRPIFSHLHPQVDSSATPTIRAISTVILRSHSPSFVIILGSILAKPAQCHHERDILHGHISADFLTSLCYSWTSEKMGPAWCQTGRSLKLVPCLSALALDRWTSQASYFREC